MTDPTNRPLWQLMRVAFCDATVHEEWQSGSRMGYAAELRAIVAWSEARLKRCYGDRLHIEALSVLAWLRGEADKAEAGE